MHEMHTSPLVAMILRHLRYVTVVAAEGSVAHAAKVLRVAQPALSRQIQSLEQLVGFTLLTRERRGVSLTAAGEVLRNGARALLDDLSASAQRARRSFKGEVGVVRIGLGRSALHDARIGAGLAAVRAEFPDIMCVTTETMSYLQTAALAAEQIDIGIGMGPAQPADDRPDAGIRSEVLYIEAINVVLLRPDHPLAGRREIRPADLRGERLITVDPAVTPTFVPMLRELRRHGFLETSEPHSHIETIWNLVAAGRGWAIAPSAYLHSPPAGTAAVKLRGFDLHMNVEVRWRAADRSRLTGNVVSVIRRVVAGDSPRLRRATPAAGVPAAQASPVLTMEMRGLRALLAAIEEGSLSDAARRLQLTQSAVSRQIRSLERAVGVPLMVRDANGVTATAAGEIVAADSHRAIIRFEQALLQARRADRGFSGVCHVGSVPTELSRNVLLE